MLDGHNVTNLAIRGTGSSYPATCISSLLCGAEAEMPFDIILSEFSVNELNGFQLLHQRLHDRFPDALIMYVHLFSLQHLHYDITNNHVHELVHGAGGQVYYFFGNTDYDDPTAFFDSKDLEIPLNNENPPPLEILELFVEDNHHLNNIGHELRHQLSKIIELFHQQIPTEPVWW